MSFAYLNSYNIAHDLFFVHQTPQVELWRTPTYIRRILWSDINIQESVSSISGHSHFHSCNHIRNALALAQQH